MFKIFAFLLIFFTLAADEEIGLIVSTPDQIASLYYDSNFLIGGCIDPQSGRLSLSSVDLVAKGAQDLSLTRVFVTAAPAQLPDEPDSEMQNYYNERDHLVALLKCHRGWVFLPHLKLELNNGEMKVPDINGAIYTFRHEKHIQTTGISNASGDTPSGRFDPRNIRIINNKTSITVVLPDGTKRVYNQHNGCYFTLVKEVLPNGMVVKYTYSGNQIIIQSFDPLEKHLYASLTVDTSSYENKLLIDDNTKNHTCGEYEHVKKSKQVPILGVPFLVVDRAEANTGVIATYTYESTNRRRDLKKKCGRFKYDFFFVPDLRTASTPFYRNETYEYEHYLPKTYSGSSRSFQASYKGSPFHIKTLELPNGAGDTYIPIYTLNVTDGATSVTHQDGCKTIYTFSKQKLPLSIQFLAPNGKVVKVKTYTWDAQNRLSSVGWNDEKGIIFWKKSFEEYDAYNNPEKEIFSGYLTGSSKVETYTTSRCFSKDGMNLLIQEETEDGLVTSFGYLPNTNLLKSKTTKGKDVLITETFEYESNNLTKKTISDGRDIVESCG